MFHKEHFCHVSSTNRGCPQYSIYVYKTTDSVETMLSEGYFNGALLDLHPNDIILAGIISDIDNEEYSTAWFRVVKRSLDAVEVEQVLTADNITYDGAGTNFLLDSKNVQDALSVLDAELYKKADKTTDFETPITASNKGATMTEINNLVQLGNKITNCILQIPQNIKLTLNGNQITLASGSTYYVPNGAGKFKAVTTSTDITYTPRSNGTRLLLMNPAGTNMDAPSITNCYSQESQPSGDSIYWWDLSNNLVKSIVSGSVRTSGISLPIALLTVDGNNVTIEKVFNGVGFMGTTIYTTPDLLVAVPNGRNSDGTLKNITTMQTIVNVYTLESFTRTELYAASTQLLAVGENTYTYDFVQNKILTGTGDQRTYIKIGTVSNNGTYITDIDLDEPFAAVDYNEYVKDLSNINETLEDINETLEDINETLEDKASLSEPQTIGGKYTFTQTIDINDSLGMQINRALDSGGTTAWRVYDATNSRQIRALGFYANSKIYNRLSIVGKTGIEGYLNFSMTDDGTMNIELSGDKEYLPSKGANNSSFATTKWVQRELGDKQGSLNSAQLNAVNSGITASKVSTYDGYATNKVGTDLSNVSEAGAKTAVGWGMPDYRAATIINMSYTAPANGYVCVNVKTKEKNTVEVIVNGTTVFQAYNESGLMVGSSCFVPVSQNDQIAIDRNARVDSVIAYFLPVKGA